MFPVLEAKQASTKSSGNRDHPTFTDIQFTNLRICSGLCEVSGSSAVDFRGPDFTLYFKYLNNYLQKL